MDKKEAEKKWCPFYRISTDDLKDNRSDISGQMGYCHSGPNCITDKCMAWNKRKKTITNSAGCPEIITYHEEGFCALIHREPPIYHISGNPDEVLNG